MDEAQSNPIRTLKSFVLDIVTLPTVNVLDMSAQSFEENIAAILDTTPEYSFKTERTQNIEKKAVNIECCCLRFV
ncbi:hypothetical protein D210916BOD24_17280 [Alteromonas sp. D210916BOD_24]